MIFNCGNVGLLINIKSNKYTYHLNEPIYVNMKLLNKSNNKYWYEPTAVQNNSKVAILDRLTS